MINKKYTLIPLHKKSIIEYEIYENNISQKFNKVSCWRNGFFEITISHSHDIKELKKLQLEKKHNILSTDFFECNVETYDCVDINLKPVNNITLKELEKFEFNGLDFDGYFSRLGFNSKGCIYEIINGFTIENN